MFLMSQTYLNIIGYHIYHKYKGMDRSRKFHQGDPGLTTFFFFLEGGGGSKLVMNIFYREPYQYF